MKTFAYSKIYLDQAADNLGDMLDCAVNRFGFNSDDFMNLFIKSGVAKEFSFGFPRVILGMTGKELCNDVYYKVFGKELSGFQYEDKYVNKTKEYWAGWILAKYQWYSCQSFETILTTLQVSDLIKMYSPLHEASEIKTFELLDNQLIKKGISLYHKINANGNIISLQEYINPYHFPVSKNIKLNKDDRLR